MSERTVSVVICTDNRLSHLKTTLRALRHLDYRAFEVIVVCGPSEDGTRAFVAAHSPPLKTADCEERNISRARNIGVALAAGEIVAFLDDDAVPEPEWLADLNAAYEDEDVAAAGGVVYDGSGLQFQASFVTIDRLGYPNFRWSAPAPHLNFPYSPEFPHLLGANCSFRRQALLELGGFDEEYEYFLDETDVLARVNDSGGRIAQCRRAAVHHKYAQSTQRDADRVVRQWGPLIKNRIYFGLRNSRSHHTSWDILRAGIADAEGWRSAVERCVAEGRLTYDDLLRFNREAEAGVEGALAAARRPRKLMRLPAEPPPLLSFETLQPAEGRLRLALVTQDYPPGHNGGIARNVEELARALAGFGHHVHVFTRARGEPSLNFEDGVWVHRAALAAGPPPPDLVPPETIPPEIWAHSRTMYAEVVKLDARCPVDFVYAPLWDCEPVAFLHEPRWPVVCALQTTLDFWLDSQPERRVDEAWMRGRGRPVLALERWALQRAPLLHANSRAIVEDISRRYGLTLSPERIALAPHGVSDWAGEPAPPEAGLRFLFVGRLESRKGVDVLLAAAPKVLRRFPQARLDVVGDDGVDEAKHKRAFLARDDVADIRDRVVFHGRVGEEALRTHYRACDVLIAPSRYESFGLVYVEGMIFGKPVIGGAAGGGPEVIEEGVTGFTVPPGDAAALAEAMMRLGEDPALRRAMGAAGRRRYEARFTAENAARLWLEAVRARLGDFRLSQT